MYFIFAVLFLSGRHAMILPHYFWLGLALSAFSAFWLPAFVPVSTLLPARLETERLTH
jgi:hypothetical protein